MKKKSYKNIIKFIVLPAVLCILGVGLTFFTLLTFKASYTVLPINHVNNFTLNPNSGNLYAGKILKGNFWSEENNLGAIALRIHNYNVQNIVDIKPVVEDKLIFRIKEYGKQNWYSINRYNGGQFRELELFPFGFKPIKDSQNKRYVFELESLNGNKTNALTLSSMSPALVSAYQFNKNDLINNNALLIKFVSRKIIYGITDLASFYTFYIFFLPLILYLLWISLVGVYLSRPINSIIAYLVRHIRKYKNYSYLGKYIKRISLFGILIFIGFILDIYFIYEQNILITIVLLSLWISRIVKQKYGGSPSFLLALIFLLLLPFNLWFDLKQVAAKSAVWIVLLLILGVLQEIIILHFPKKVTTKV